jgi:hypothetical protein
VAVSGDPCDRGATLLGHGAGVLFVLGWLFVGGAVYGAARAVSERAWLAWTSAVVMVAGLALASYVLLVWQWVGECSN